MKTLSQRDNPQVRDVSDQPGLRFMSVSGRFGMPSDIAGVALFLSSPASAHVTGGHIIVDGGCTLSSQGIAPQSRL